MPFIRKVARKLVKHRPRLHKESMQTIHERAMAMGDDDPLKPGYSNFLTGTSNKTFSNAVPLRHGHLENYHNWRNGRRIKAVTRIQNLYRGRVARKSAEMKAKQHAFLCARTVALEDTSRRISAEIWKVPLNMIHGCAH